MIVFGIRTSHFLKSKVSSFSRLSYLKSAKRNFSDVCKKNTKMKLVQFTHFNNPEEIRVGIWDENKIIDINKTDPNIPSTLLEILRTDQFGKVQRLAASSENSFCESDVLLKAPIHGVDKVLCIGLNYQDHCEEQNIAPPQVPMIFSKFSSCLIGPSDTLKIRTGVTKKVDWEVEMAVIIGKKASKVKASDAMQYVFGYTVAQDISARDWQKEYNAGQFLLGKAMDGFCPIGPCITTADSICNPNNLKIKCSVNQIEKQCSNTKNLIHKIPDVIERLTCIMTLLPGDIILTGTPGGVGMHRNPPEYLKPGDVIASEIQSIGTLTTKVVEYC